MSPLTLTPFPSLRSDGQSHSWPIEHEGFVDESVVQAVMLIQSAPFRRQIDPGDLALAANDLDFAGWHAPRQTLDLIPPLPVPQEKAPAPRLAIAKPIAFERPAVTGVSKRAKRKAPAPIKNRGWIPVCAGMLTLALSSILLATLAAERDFTFRSIVKEIFHLPTAAEKFEKATASKASQAVGED